MLPDSTLEAQSSMVSDHSPLILTGNAATSTLGFALKVFGPSCRDTLRQFKQCGTDLYMFTTRF